MSGYEYEVSWQSSAAGNIKTTTNTSGSVSGLNNQGDYFFIVRAVNPGGKGDWSRQIWATLNPSQSGLLQVSPVTVTVNEGASTFFTVRLSHAPPIRYFCPCKPGAQATPTTCGRIFGHITIRHWCPAVGPPGRIRLERPRLCLEPGSPGVLHPPGGC